MEKDHRFMTVEEAAQVLRVAVWYIRKQIKKGTLPAIKVGKAFMIEAEDFERFIKTLEVKPHA